MHRWLNAPRYDPIAPLLASGDEALVWHVRKELLEEKAGPARDLWELPEVMKIVRRQQEDGSFPYPGKKHDVYPEYHYALFETWKQFRFLVDQFAFTKRSPTCRLAAEFLFSCQSEVGDIRGMLANQYATYYTGAILGLLIKAGYGDDPRVEKGLQWLLAMRQDDGGWTIPLLTAELSREAGYRLTSEYADPIEPDRSKPFSHNWTGMVLRAFAAHPRYRRLKAARVAARLLKTRFFEKDSYTSYQSADYWIRFQYPFWWNHLVAAMDSLSLIGVPRDDPDMQRGLDWLDRKSV
ncbi:MAG: prenyltransferase/squalene oxidase repeat-containing protein, partial [Phycisphaerales bacterium JB038]